MDSPASIKKGREVDIRLERFADRGKSLARVDGYVIFVEGAVPGDLVRALILRKKKRHAEAAIVELLEPSSLRIEPTCSYFGSCGGCKWQQVSYQAQLDAKRASVADALEHVGRVQGLEVEPTVPADSTYYYRNKMEFSFGAERWLTSAEIATGQKMDRSFALGLHAPRSFAKIIDVKECHLQSAWSASLVNRVRDIALLHGWTPWNVRKQEGFLRHLVIRQSHRTGESLANIVTSEYDQERMSQFAEALRSSHPELTTLVNTINRGTGQTAIGDECLTLFGPGFFREELGRFKFRISAGSFFQTNTAQAEKLYDLVVEFADLRQDDTVFDLYCGAGSIGIYISDFVRSVVGIELVPEAVSGAKANAEINNVTNCQFVQGDALRLFNEEFVARYGRPDLVIVDPPRAGLHKKVVAQIVQHRPDRIVYVSCNPQTMARDVGLLGEHYAVDRVCPIDLFPQTYHTEAVVRLTVRPAGRTDSGT